MIAALLAPGMAIAQKNATDYNTLVAAIQPQVIAWRRHLHQYPELSNREVKTAEYVANHLRKLGLEIRTQVGLTVW